jgi:hypothetical protein
VATDWIASVTDERNRPNVNTQRFHRVCVMSQVALWM